MIAGLISGTVKGVRYVSKKIAYDKAVNDEVKRKGSKKEEEKEKEDSKKSEKEIQKSQQKEKEKVKIPEVKKEEKKNTVSKNKNNPELTQVQKAFFEWNKKAMEDELSFLNNKNLLKDKSKFLNRLARVTLLKQMEISEKKEPSSVSSREYERDFNTAVKTYKDENIAFKHIGDSIKNEEDMKKFVALANNDNGNGLYNEIAKHQKLAEEEKAKAEINQNKKLDKNLESKIENPQVGMGYK